MYNMQRWCQKWNGQEYSLFWIYWEHATSDVKYATSDVKHETCNISRQKCNILHILWSIDVKHETGVKIREYFYFGFIQDMQHLMSNMQLWRSTCNKWRKTWNLQHFHVKYATYYVKYAILTSNIKRTRIFENIQEYFLFWLYLRHATSNVKHAIVTFNMQSWHSTCNNWHYTWNL